MCYFWNAYSIAVLYIDNLKIVGTPLPFIKLRFRRHVSEKFCSGAL